MDVDDSKFAMKNVCNLSGACFLPEGPHRSN